MQRRPPKLAAHISPPTPTAMFFEQEKSPRLTPRTSTNRIWLIIAVVVSVVFVTYLIFPYSHPSPHRWTNAHLKAINYLNDTTHNGYPFKFCPEGRDGDELSRKYGPSVLSQTRLHLGSGARIQSVLHRALRGEPVTISIVGGSVSACHGAGDDPISPLCYPSRFFQWWNTVFPHPASELTNGAMRRSSSKYFAFCHAHHIPDMTDLIILDFDVDDSGDKETLTNFEILVRSLLIRQDTPAVLILGHFSPQVQQMHGWSGPEHWHTQVATFYDVPHISTKPILYPSYMASPSSVSRHYADPILANPSGHALLADVLIAYFQSQICRAWDIVTGHNPAARLEEIIMAKGKANGKIIKGRLDGEFHGLFGGVGERKGVPPEKAPGSDEEPDADRKQQPPNLDVPEHAPSLLRLLVPPVMINTRPGEVTFEEVRPWCVSANDLINPLPPSLFYGSGWSAFHPPSGQPTASQTPSAHYYYSTVPTSRLRIPLQIGAGDVGVYYLQESLEDVGDGSSVECWVDNNYGGAVRLGNSSPDVSSGDTRETLVMIDHHVTKGSHYVECQLMGEEDQNVPPFKIVGVFAT